MFEERSASFSGLPQLHQGRNGFRSSGPPHVGGSDPPEWAEPVARLAGRLAHYFNNLLTVVDGNVTFVLERLDDESSEECLREIRSACRRAAGLTTQLLALSGSQWAAPRVVDLRRLVSDLELSTLCPGGVAFCTDLPLAPCRVWADPAHLEAVTRALVLNAREAVGDRGTIRLAVDRVSAGKGEGESPCAWIQLEVSDSGPGMDEVTLGRALEPYFTTRDPDQDRGLGLSVAYGIVRQNGGAMALSSAPGEGTTVRVWLPAAPEGEDRPAARRPGPRRVGLPARRRGTTSHS